MSIKTEYEFILPKGYVDNEGTLHKKGVMRLATAKDRVLPREDPRVAKNPNYLLIIVLSRVVVKLGTLRLVNTAVIEKLFAADWKFLVDLYREINEDSTNNFELECTKCGHKFKAEVSLQGGA